MSIIAWIVLGLIAGAIAKGLMPGDDPGGIIVTILIGIVGAVIGGFLWTFLTGNTTYEELDIGGIAIAVVGAIILLWGYRMVAGGTAPRYVRLRPRRDLAAIFDKGNDDVLPERVNPLVAKITIEILNLRPTMSYGLADRQ